MSQFTPTTRAIFPGNEPDLLAGSVLKSLTRPLYHRLSWGPLRSAVLGFLTLGALPTLLLPRWLKRLTAQHEQQLWYFGEWLRLRTGDPQTAAMQTAARQIRFSRALAIATWVFAAIAGAAVIAHYSVSSGAREGPWYFATHPAASPEAALFQIAIALAAVCNWIHLSIHQSHVERCLEHFNELASRHGIDGLPTEQLRDGIGAVSLICGIIFAMNGAVWLLPVMLAAGAHRRYTIETSVRTRAALADRMQRMLSQQRPALRVPKPIITWRRCIRPLCRAPLSDESVFCPRCGTRNGAPRGAVA